MNGPLPPMAIFWIVLLTPNRLWSDNLPTEVEYRPAQLLGQLENKKIDESSGLAASIRHPGFFWTHNDSGDKPRLFAFDTKGQHQGVSLLRGAESVDWEDMGTFLYQDLPYVFVADTGCNDHLPRDYVIYTALEPKTPKSDTDVVHRIEFTYEDTQAHNCEAVAYDARDNQFLLIEKRAHKQLFLNSPVWQLSWDPTKRRQRQVARRVGAIDFPVVTGLDLSPDGRRGFAITYFGNGAELRRKPDEDWTTALKRPLRIIELPPRKQGEAVCYGNDGKTLFLTSEKEPSPFYMIPIRETEPNQ